MLLLTGCTTAESKFEQADRGKLRHELFVECMELASKNPRKSDDDVHKIVDACGQESFYMANHMRP